MKNKFAFVLLGISMLVAFACSKEKQEETTEAKPVIKLEEPVIPSAKFASFVNGFGAALPPAVYDHHWLESFLDNNKVREISPKVCEDFIHGNEIWNHGFDKQAKKRLAADKPYYYIGQIADTGKYIMLIFTDLQEKATETYLCTYTKDGKFISGIVLQADYVNTQDASAPLASKRICRIPANSKPTLIIEETYQNQGTKASVYSISRDGIIQPEQHSS
ncbi:MAG: hypothetical protein ACPGJS_23375 [Flammeovirgaceae bacterium]